MFGDVAFPVLRAMAGVESGYREFAAGLEPAPQRWTIPDELRQWRDLGLLLLDLDFVSDRSSRPTPRFFDTVLEYGRVEVPEVTR